MSQTVKLQNVHQYLFIFNLKFVVNVNTTVLRCYMECDVNIDNTTVLRCYMECVVNIDKHHSPKVLHGM